MCWNVIRSGEGNRPLNQYCSNLIRLQPSRGRNKRKGVVQGTHCSNLNRHVNKLEKIISALGTPLVGDHHMLPTVIILQFPS
ncbi:uncharacterized protein SPAPADRAFT_58694, partial [Spathaspora passalidarum NRRL Y-27907]